MKIEYKWSVNEFRARGAMFPGSERAVYDIELENSATFVGDGENLLASEFVFWSAVGVRGGERFFEG